MTDLTPALESFLARTDVATPYVVIDLDVALERYHRLAAAIPEATIFYAVKANPVHPLIERLVAVGSSFDVASPAEIDRCLDAGAAPERISYGNTIKKRRDIAYAASCGVKRFAIDAEPELDKIVDVAPDAEVCVRLRHDCGGADWPLSRKFGCEPLRSCICSVSLPRPVCVSGCRFTSVHSSATCRHGTPRCRWCRRSPLVPRTSERSSTF